MAFTGGLEPPEVSGKVPQVGLQPLKLGTAEDATCSSAAAPQVVRMLRQAGWAAWHTTAAASSFHHCQWRVVKVDMEASYYWPEWSLWQRLLWKLFG